MYQPLDAVPSVPPVIGSVPVKARFVVTYRDPTLPEGVCICRDTVTAFSAQQAVAAWINHLGKFRADKFEIVSVSRVGERG